MLVFDAGKVGIFDVFRIRELRALGREVCVLVVKMIHQEAGGENVAAGDIGLQFREVSEAQDVIVVLPDGQGGVDQVVILAVKCVVEPHFVLDDRTRERQ